jgi:hypothetical protein
MPAHKVIATSLDQIIGQTFIDYEHSTEDESVSGSDEVILHFSGGSEILIYFHQHEKCVKVEGD